MCTAYVQFLPLFKILITGFSLKAHHIFLNFILVILAIMKIPSTMTTITMMKMTTTMTTTMMTMKITSAPAGTDYTG